MLKTALIPHIKEVIIVEKKFSYTLAGRPLVIETGKLAQLANGSALVRYGDTVVLSTATASKSPREGVDFFPLSVDYEEKLYSVGKIPGSFTKREGKPTDKAILTSRVIDRPIRPLFPKDMRNDVSVVSTVMSVEQDNSPEVAAMIGASIAISISDIPFDGPIGGVFVGMVDGEIIINPTAEQRAKSVLQLTVAGTKEKVVMIEAGAKEVSEDDMYNAIVEAHKEIIKLCEFIESIVAEIGKPKFEYEPHGVCPELYEDTKAYAKDAIEKALDTDDKTVRDNNLAVVIADTLSHLSEKYPELTEGELREVFEKIQKEIVRHWLINEHKRVDGRTIDQIRPLSADVSLLPRVHGSGLFQRGQTQVLTTVTLGPMSEVQKLDGLDEEVEKRYIHHYNFPSYSVGETKPSRGPGRREVGHGALAERALEPVIPAVEDFPYAIRLVSEVLSSNGSTSQGSVCGSTLALMDAGVPIIAPVAGISVGLVTEGERYLTMLDIQGLEDFYGDMDFKVAGTKNGITAIQMDIKIHGLTYDIIKEAFQKTKDARNYILDEVMLKAIPEVRSDLSPFAPKITTIKIDVEKIREVIGPGGKVIQNIVAESGAKIDIEEDGTVYIAAVDQASGNKALDMISDIIREPEVGQIYTGKVVSIKEFGAFVEFLPGKEGLCHISELDNKRVAKVEDVCHEGDEIVVKLKNIDAKTGKFSLSRKAALYGDEPKEEN